MAYQEVFTKSFLNDVKKDKLLLERLYKKIVRVLPAKEGTGEWWARENELAMEDYRAGKYTEHASVDEYIKAMEKKFGL